MGAEALLTDIEVPRAALVLPHRSDQWMAACVAIGRAHGWDVRTVLTSGEEWVRIACERRVEIGIVPSSSHLDPQRMPRLVAADELHRPLIPPPGTGRAALAHSHHLAARACRAPCHAAGGD